MYSLFDISDQYIDSFLCNNCLLCFVELAEAISLHYEGMYHDTIHCVRKIIQY